MCILNTSVDTFTMLNDTVCFLSTSKPPKCITEGFAITIEFCAILVYISEMKNVLLQHMNI